MSKPKYTYSFHHGYWRVYKMTYIKSSSYGEEIDAFNTKKEASDKVYELNGWKPKTAPQH